MTFPYSATLTNYLDLRYLIIRNLEEKGGVPSLTVYTDSKGLATIGAGFLVQAQATAILEEMGYSGNPSLPAYAQAITNAAIGVNFGQGAAGALAAQAALDKALRQATGNSGATFVFPSQSAVEQVFNNIAVNFETNVDSWLTSVPQSRERLALLSLAYNGVLARSLSLKTAIQSEDRAWAWYEIRYHSNRSQLVGVAKRRFMESALFGLFTDSSNVSPEAAKDAYRFLQDHRNQILAYESRWGLNPDGTRGNQRDKQGRTGLEAVKDDYGAILQYAGLAPGTYPKLDWTFDPAKTALLAYLRAVCEQPHRGQSAGRQRFRLNQHLCGISGWKPARRQTISDGQFSEWCR